MACTLDTYALVDLDTLKSFLNITTDDLEEDAFSIYHDTTGGGSAGTVALSGDTLTLTVTGGDTDAIDLTATANDTLGELVAVINALAEPWIATQQGRDDIPSSDLNDYPSTSAWGIANEQTLTFINNCQLTELINMMTDVIERYFDRQFKKRTRTEQYRSHQDGLVKVKHYPINAIDWVSIGTRQAISITNTDSTAAGALVNVDYDPIQSSTNESHVTGIKLIIQGGTNDGEDTVSISSSVTLSAAITSINAVGKGWSASLYNSDIGNLPSDQLITIGGLYCLNQTVYLEVPDEPISWYTIDPERGMFKVGRPNSRVFTKYDGGYATVPDDIQMLALTAFKILFEGLGQDSTLEAERLGEYSYRRGSIESSVRQAVVTSSDFSPSQIHYGDLI